jgi:tellurite methyltransferase
VERVITGYHCDEAGDWVAELDCGHNQHVRHRPPFQVREWVLDSLGRAARLGTILHCRLCDRGELPNCLRLVRTTKVWDERTIPNGLRRGHRVATGNWGRIMVHAGGLRFRAATTPVMDVELEAGSKQAIPPGVDHEVEPIGPVQFSIEFLAVTTGRSAGARDAMEMAEESEGGDPACWAGLICSECGAVVDDGHHRPGCSALPFSS